MTTTDFDALIKPAPLEVVLHGGVNADADLTPEDAIKVVRRARKITFFIRTNAPLITERNGETLRCYADHNNIRVAQLALLKWLENTADSNAHRTALGRPSGRIAVSRRGNCLFFG